MEPQIVNVDILDDKEPVILVQKYVYPDRTFQVFRKPTVEWEEEEFVVSPGVTIDRDLYWGITFTLFETTTELGEDFWEIYALVYRDEENPPFRKGEKMPGAQECVAVIYDPETGTYGYEACLPAYDEVESVTATTLDEAIALGVDKLHEILAHQEQ